MAKTIFIDGVFTILHFNSSPKSYLESRQNDTFSGECCFCYSPIKLPPNDIGEQKEVFCNLCKNKLVYFTIHLNNNLEKVLDVHFYEKSGINGIMHILLPVDCPEFNKFIKSPLFFQKSNMSDLLRFSYIMNKTKELFFNEIQDRVNSKKYFIGANNIIPIYNSIKKFEKFIVPGVSEEQHSLDPNDITDAANFLYSALLNRYPANNDNHKEVKVDTNILKVCFDIINFERNQSNKETTQDKCSKSNIVPTITQKEKSFEIKTNINNILALSFIDEDEIIIGGADGKVGLWKISNGSQKKNYKFHTQQVLQAKRVNEEYFATSGEDGLVCVWYKRKNKVDRYFDFDKFIRPPSFSLQGIGKTCVPIVLPHQSNDFIILFPSGSSAFPPYLWKPESNKIYFLGGSDKIPCGINTGCINNEGNCIVYSSNTSIIGYDISFGYIIFEFGGLPIAHLNNQTKNILYYTDSELQNNVIQKICENHRKRITYIEFSNNDQFFATGSEDSSIRLWDFEDISHNFEDVSNIFEIEVGNHPKPIVFDGLNNNVISISFLENDELLLGASQDGEIIIWEIATKKLVKKIASTLDEITSFAISPDKEMIAFGSKGGLVQIISI